jgi:gliding motility-associated-like protein
MKLLSTLLILLSLLTIPLQGQVKFKVKLSTDNVTYQVYLKPDITWSPPANTVPNAQVTLVVPTGGFKVSNLVNNKGVWTNNVNIVAPIENPGYDYIVFGLQGITTAITFQKDIEILLFSFKNTGNCTGKMQLINHATDPFMPPNSKSVNVGNQISVAGAGAGINAYTGNYGSNIGDCKGALGCGIQVFDIDINGPTTCGVADGSITITATNTNGLLMQYSINKGLSYSSSNVFSGLAAGQLYEIIVRDIAAICIVNVGAFTMPGPLAAVVTGVDKVNPDCNKNNGSFKIHAYSEIGNPIQYAISPNFIYQDSNTFTGLAPGMYKLFVKDAIKNCSSEIGTFELAACPPEPCLITYQLEKLPNDKFQISMISDTTWTFPNNIVSSAQWTIKLPTGGFVVSNLESKLSGVTFNEASSYIAPVEDPTSDYISFILGSPGTTDIPFTKGQKVPLFTFENGGNCKDGQVTLIDNKTDPFFPPNSLDGNIGQQLTVSGFGGADLPVCIDNLPAPDCSTDPCKQLIADFTAPISCQGESVSFTNTTTSSQIVKSWTWNFGDGSGGSMEQNPTHVYNAPGDYQVVMTVTTDGGCSTTVTKTLRINPKPAGAPKLLYNICFGDTVQLQSPANVTALWNPAGGLSNPNITNPLAFPTSTTDYTGTFTNNFGCSTSSLVKVAVEPLPVIDSIIIANVQNCDINNGVIEIKAKGGNGTIEYSIDNGVSWTSGAIFSNLSPGNYQVRIRYQGASCQVVYSKNPVNVSGPPTATLSAPLVIQPTGCQSDGSIQINASDGVGPLRYSIDGGNNYESSPNFQNLGPGAYKIAVTNSNGSCKVSSPADVILASNHSLVLLTKPEDINICGAQSSGIIYKLSEKISSFNVLSTSSHFGASALDSLLSFQVNPGNGTAQYIVELIGSSNCRVLDTFIVNTLAVPTSFFEISGNSCSDSIVQIQYTGDADSSAVLNWVLDGAEILKSSLKNDTKPAAAELSVKWTAAGNKNLSLTATKGTCSSTTNKSLIINTFDATATMGITPVAGCGTSNGAIKLSLSKPGNYSFVWSGPGAEGVTDQSLNKLPGGTYTVTITDQDTGCRLISSGVVPIPPPISIDSLDVSDRTNCDENNPNGSIAVFFKGGTAPFTIRLYKNENFSAALDSFISNITQVRFENLSEGKYFINVLSSTGCYDTMSASIRSFSTNFFVAGTEVTNADCGESNGLIRIQIAGGMAPFEYHIFRNGRAIAGNLVLNSNTLELSDLNGAEYNVIFIDANDCAVSSTTLVGNVSKNNSLTAELTNPGCGLSNGTIALTGYINGSTFIWKTSEGVVLSNSDKAEKLPGGVYHVTITEPQGCTQTKAYVLSAASSTQLEIVKISDATCGATNGSLDFTVRMGGPFYYNVLNTSTKGLGMPGDTLSVIGIGAGAYVVEIIDTLSSCASYNPVVIQGQNIPRITTFATSPTECGISNATICVKVESGVSPYILTSDLGTGPLSPFNSEACITGLYEGLVRLKIRDSLGCVTELGINLPKLPEPTISADDIIVSGYTCPDELGSIVSATNHQFSVYDTNNFFLGKTPLKKVPAGIYKVANEAGNCIAERTVTIFGPEKWQFLYTSSPESCLGKNGSIDVSVSGGTGTYRYKWSTGDTTQNIAGLVSGNTYSVTVTDGNGCNLIKDSINVALNCKVICPELFLVDTFNVLLQDGRNEICLPTRLTSITGFNLLLNNSEYLDDISYCFDSTSFYSYGTLQSVGTGPYRLEEWKYKGKSAATYMFTQIEELVSFMNLIDPSGNWTINLLDKSIIGGSSKGAYGSLSIRHLATNTILSLQVNTLAVSRPSIFVPLSNYHIFIMNNPVTNCKDTLFINRIIPPPAFNDTMSVTIQQGEIKDICLPLDSLNGNPVSFQVKCEPSSGNSKISTLNSECLEIEGLETGLDTFCIEICDDKGSCITFNIKLEVKDTSTNIIVYNGLTPNDDGINDNLIIKNIHRYPDNNLYVFNRWGLEVFSTKGYSNSNPWDGRFKNKVLPDGSYFYVLEIHVNGKKRKLSGFLEINR